MTINIGIIRRRKARVHVWTVLPPLNGERLVIPVLSGAVNIDICVYSSL